MLFFNSKSLIVSILFDASKLIISQNTSCLINHRRYLVSPLSRRNDTVGRGERGSLYLYSKSKYLSRMMKLCKELNHKSALNTSDASTEHLGISKISAESN